MLSEDFLNIGGLSDRKNKTIEEKSADKNTYLDWVTERVDVGYQPDADTFHTLDKEKIRMLGVNTFESSVDVLKDLNPLAVRSQKLAFSRAFDKPVNDVTLEDIAAAGQVSKEISENVIGDSVRVRRSGTDVYGRTLAKVFDDSGRNIATDVLGDPGINAGLNTRFNSKERRIEAEVKRKKTILAGTDAEFNSGYDDETGEPKVHVNSDGSYNYGQLKGLDRFNLEKMMPIEDAKHKVATTTWSKDDGVLNFVARIVSGGAKTFSEVVTKPFVGNILHKSAETLEESISDYNLSGSNISMETGKRFREKITSDDIDKYRDIVATPHNDRSKQQLALMQDPKIQIIAEHAEDLSEKIVSYEDIDLSNEELDKIVNRVEDTIVDQGMDQAYESGGFVSALVYGVKNIGNMSKRIGDSLPFMAILAASPYVSVPAMAGMIDSNVHENTQQFKRINKRNPDSKERAVIDGWSTMQGMFEKIEAGVISGKFPGLVEAMIGVRKGLQPATKFLAKGFDIVVGEFISGAGSEFSKEIASKQDISEVDWKGVNIGGIQEMMAAGGMATVMQGGRKIFSAPNENQVINKIDKLIQQRVTIIGSDKANELDVSKASEDIVKLRTTLETMFASKNITDKQKNKIGKILEDIDIKPKPTAKKPIQYKVTKGLGGAKTQEILNTSFNVLTGKEKGNKTQAVVDLMTVVQNADEIFGEGAEQVRTGASQIIKDNAKEIFAASKELSQIKDRTEKELGVVLSSLGSGEQVNTSKVEGLSKVEVDAIDAVNIAIEKYGTKEMQRVTSEIADTGTKNVSIKDYITGTLDTGKIASGFTKFNTHMQAKAKAFTEAAETAGDGVKSYIKKGMGDYTIHTKVPSDAIKTKSGVGYDNYFTIHSGSKPFVERTNADAVLVKEFYGLAEAVVAGKESRVETIDMAKELGQEIVKSGVLDKGEIKKDGEVKEEKVKGKEEAQAEEVRAKRKSTKPTTKPSAKPVAKPVKGDSARLKEDIPIQETIPEEAQEQDVVEPAKPVKPEVIKTSEPIIANDGKTEIVAKKVGNKIYISTNKKLWKQYYTEKRWTKPRVQPDGSKAKALPEDIFKSEQELYDFVDIHESGHLVLGQKKGESDGDYESRINEYAIGKLGLGKKINWFDNIKNKMVSVGREYTVTMVEILKHTVSKKDSFLSGTPLSVLSNESQKNREITRLTKEFKKAGEKYINPDPRKQDLIYSFNNLMVKHGKELSTPDEYYYAMANSFASWMAASGRKTLTNDEHDISGILYGEWEHSLTGQEVEAMAGIGTPLYMIAEGAGANMAKVLGLKVEIPKGMNKEDQAMLGKLTNQKSFERSLGLMMLDLAGKLESNPVTVEHHAAIDLGSASTAKNKSKDNTIKLNTIKLVSDSLVKTFASSDNYFEDINGVQMDKKDIYTDKPRESVENRVPGSMSELPGNRKTMLRKLQDVVWKPIDNNVDTFLGFTGDQQKVIAGWKDPKSVHIDLQPAVVAKNRQIEKQIADLQGLKSKKFWFGYYLMNQFRIMIDSNGINPLSSKNLHRFMVNPEGAKITFKKGSEQEVMFKYSIVQALGKNVDKTDHQGVMDDFDQVVIKFGNLAQNINGQEVADRGVNAHGLAGLVALGDWLKVENGGEVTTHLGLEVDGITNGYALGLLQFPNDTDGKLWGNLARVGVTDKKGKYEENIHGVVDAYNRAGIEFKKVLEEQGLLQAFEGVYGPVDRNLMKSPFMIFNYGASAHKAAEGIAKAISKKIYSGEVDGNSLGEFTHNLGIITNITVGGKNFMTTEIKDEIAILEKDIQRKFSSIVEQAFEPLVGSTSEIKQKLTQAMDAVASGFALEFAEKSRELVGKLVVEGPVHPKMIGSNVNPKAGKPIRLSRAGLTQKEMRQVAESLIDTHYPLLSGAWNESAKGEKQAFIDMVSRDRVESSEQAKNAMLKESDQTEVRERLAKMVRKYDGTRTQAENIAKLIGSDWSKIKNDPKLKVKGKLSFNKVVKLIQKENLVPTESTVSLGGFAYGHPGAKMLVRSIQNLDASIMGKTVDGSDSFLGLHDAVYVGINKIQETVSRINQNALELSREYSVAQAVLEQFEKVGKNVQEADHRLAGELKKIFESDRVYEVKALIERANKRLKRERKKRWEGNVDSVNKQIVGIVNDFVKVVGDRGLLDLELPAINKRANLDAWDKDYKETSKEKEDQVTDRKRPAKYRKNPTYTPPSQKLEPLRAIVGKNNKDRENLFGKIEEVVQYYMPDSKKEEVDLGSLGKLSKQDIQQDAVSEILRGNTTAENVSQVNEMLGADNKDITRVLKELVQPLMEKIDGLSVSLKGYSGGVYAEGEFRSADNAVEMVYNVSGPETRTEQTAQEVFGHEMIHAVSWRAVQSNQRFRKQLEQLRDAISKDVGVKDFLVDGDTSENAKKNAERQYLAVFGKDSLQEFLAYGLTNPVLIQKLKGIKAQESKWFSGDTWYEKVLSAMVKAIEVIEGLINKKDSKSGYEQLFSLAQEVNGINQSKASKVAQALDTGKVYDTSDEAIKAFVGKHERFARELLAKVALKGMKLSYGTARVFPKFKGKVGEKITLAGHAATLAPGMIARLLFQLVGKDVIFINKDGDEVTYGVKDKDGNLLDPGKALIYSLAELHKDIEGTAARELFKLVTDVTVGMPVDLQRALSESKRKVEQSREAVKEMVSLVMSKDFGDRKPTDSESRMLTKVIGKADLQALTSSYSADIITELVVSDSKLNALIQSEKRALVHGGMNGWWDDQAEGLSDRMVNQEQGRHLVFDNVLAMQKHSTSEINDLDRMDRYISLLALQKTDGRGKVAKFIKENKEGFKSALNTFVSLDSAGKESFVDSEILMTKGHIPKIGDPHKAIEVAAIDPTTKEQMRLRGYEWKYDLENYAGNKVGMYFAKNLPMESQVKGLLSRTGKHMAHTSMMAKWKEEYNTNTLVDDRRYKDLKKYQNLMLKKEINTKRHKKALRPVVNEKGKIVDLTIDMNFEREEALLGLNMNVVDIASTASMNTVDKINSEEVNESGIDLLIKRQEEHRVGNEWEFVNLMDVDSVDYLELFTRLPYKARKKIEKYANANNGKFYVEEVWLDAIFGYENWSIGNLIKDESKKRKAKVVEEVVKGIVGIINNNIVVKTPAVWGGNFASNFVTSVISGLGTFETIRYWKEGLDNLKEYQKNAAEVQVIDFKSRASQAYRKANKSRRDLLTDKMNKSSVSELMDAGLYSAITTEEMQTDEYSYKNKAVRALSEATGKIKGGKTLGKVVKGLYLAEDTSAYKSLLGMVQVSDFLGRYGIYRKMVDEQGKSKDEAYSYVQDVFVDFNIPVGKITQYANSMGMILFYKYWSRIQRATLGMIKHHPTKSMQTILMRSVLGIEIDTIFNSGIITGGNMAPMAGWIDLIKMIQQFIMPSGLEIGIGLGGSTGMSWSCDC